MSKIITLGANAPAILKLTRTMLDKHIIDANASVRAFGELLGIDYADIEAGDRVNVPAKFLEGEESSITFYKTKRGDRRFSVRGLKKQADAGDTVAVTFEYNHEGEFALVINVTRNAEYSEQLGVAL